MCFASSFSTNKIPSSKMKYTLAYAISALAAVAAAQKPSFLNTQFNIQAGQPFTLQFNNCDGGCTILLENGVSTALQPVKTLSSTFLFLAVIQLRWPLWRELLALMMGCALPCLADTLAADATGSSLSITLDSSLPSDTYALKITNNENGEFNYSEQFAFKGSASATASMSSAASTTASTAVVTVTTGSTSTSKTTVTSTTTTMGSSTSMSQGTTTMTSESLPLRCLFWGVPFALTLLTSLAGTPSSSPSPTPASTTVPGAAGRISSPIALVAGAIAAFYIF